MQSAVAPAGADDDWYGRHISFPALLTYVPFGQSSGAAIVVRTTVVAVVVTARAAVASVVAGSAVVVTRTTVVLVVEVDVLVVVLVLVLVEVDVDVDSTTGGAGALGRGDCGGSVKGAITRPTAKKLPRTPTGTWPHIGSRRNALHDRLSSGFIKVSVRMGAQVVYDIRAERVPPLGRSWRRSWHPSDTLWQTCDERAVSGGGERNA